MSDVASLQISSSLIDDYLQFETPPVAPGQPGSFIAMPDVSGSPTLLTLDPDGDLLQFVTDSTSHSGWSTSSAPLSKPRTALSGVTELVSFGQSGSLNVLAFYIISKDGVCSPTWTQQQSGGWAPVSGVPAPLLMTLQTDSYVDADGNQFLYGVSTNLSVGDGIGFFLLGMTQNGCELLHQQALADWSLSNNVTYRTLPGTDGNQFSIFWFDQGALSFQGASIEQGAFQWAPGSPTTFNLGLGLFAATQILPLPGVANQDALLLVNDSQALILLQGYATPSPNATPLTGSDGQPAGVTSVTAGVDGSGDIFVFAAERGTSLLWIARQAATAPGAPLLFTDWVCLGDLVSVIAAPPLCAGGPELFAIDLGQNVFHITQTASDHVWATRQIATPSPSSVAPQNVATFTMELTATDANQVPASGAIVSVCADQPATIIAADIAMHLIPGVPVPLQADAIGRLTVAMQATTLTAPVLTFRCVNQDGTSVSRWCQGDVVQVLPGDPAIPPCPQSVAQRLANQDPTKPLTGDALVSAQLVNPAAINPNDAADAIIGVGAWMVQNAQDPPNSINAAALRTQHWRIDCDRPGEMRFTRLSMAEGQQLVEAATALGSFSGFVGDVIHKCQHLWHEVKSIVVSVQNGVVNLVIDGTAYVVQTCRQAASALEMIVTWCIQGLTDTYDSVLLVIDFLRQLLDWGDILQTHLVLKWGVTQLVSQFTQELPNAQAWLDARLATLKSDVDTKLQNLEAVFQQQSLNTFVNALPGSAGTSSGNALAGTATTTAYAQHATRCNYVFSKAKAYFSSSPAPQPPGGNLTSGILQEVQASWMTGDLSSPLDTFTAYANSQLGSGQSLFDLAIVDFLQACQPLIDFFIDGAKDIADALLTVAAESLTGLFNSLGAPVDIPVLSWLWTDVITGTSDNPGQPLTVLDVFCLLLAVPATILYKVANNNAAPFSADDASTITTSTLPWPGSAGATSDQGPLRALPASLSDVMSAVAAAAGFFAIFLDPSNDSLAFAQQNDEPTGEDLPGLGSFLSTASVINGFVSQLGSFPWSLFSEPSSSWQSGDDWTITLWAAQAVPLLYDTAFTYATGNLARYTNELGPALDTGAGFILLAIGAATAVEQSGQGTPYTGWDYAGDVISQTQLLFKCALFTKDTEDEVIGLPLLLAVDVLVDIGALVVALGGLVEG